MSELNYQPPSAAELLVHLKELLHYDPVNGVFTWLVERGRNKRLVGKQAGTVNGKGYVQISIHNRLYLAHRLAWLYYHGVWPDGELDHKDTVKSHNWIENLREATQSQNNANRKMYRNNTSGYKGVSWNSYAGKWCAAIQVRGRTIRLGYFNSPEEAHTAYMTEAETQFGEYRRSR